MTGYPALTPFPGAPISPVCPECGSKNTVTVTGGEVVSCYLCQRCKHRWGKMERVRVVQKEIIDPFEWMGIDVDGE